MTEWIKEEVSHSPWRSIQVAVAHDLSLSEAKTHLLTTTAQTVEEAMQILLVRGISQPVPTAAAPSTPLFRTTAAATKTPETPPPPPPPSYTLSPDSQWPYNETTVEPDWIDEPPATVSMADLTPGLKRISRKHFPPPSMPPALKHSSRRLFH